VVVVISIDPVQVRTQQQTSTKYLLADAARKDGAVCIDGTPGAYYFRPGSGSGADKWYIHHEGGGWCYNSAACYSRSLTDLGSSKNYPNTATINYGYFSTNPTANPLMYNWNSVYLKYCDGGSFSGNNETTDNYNGHELHYRGFRILNAMFNDLFDIRGLNKASDVVISGCSAGGLATYLHVDWWRAKLPNSKVVGMPDSGFFLDYEAGPNYHGNMIWVFNQMNSTSGVNARCIAAYAAADRWHCIFAEHTSPHITTPIFPLQSQYDSWQIPNILGSNNPVDINKYGALLVSLVNADVLNNNANSIILDSCHHHCGGWDTITIDGETQAKAFSTWYGGNNHRFIDNKPYPCTSCTC